MPTGSRVVPEVPTKMVAVVGFEEMPPGNSDIWPLAISALSCVEAMNAR